MVFLFLNLSLCLVLGLCSYVLVLMFKFVIMFLCVLVQNELYKVMIYNYCFVGFYSVPNLIVILLNLLYPVFIVGFNCKGCVIVRENVKTQAIED